MSIPNFCPYCASEEIRYFGNSFSVKDDDGDYFVIDQYICESCDKEFYIN